uniref:Acetyltransferase n=1 Tax=Pristionchus pacificus TaxID=54126 RepID=A0A2A6BQI1_PRIPA|eukprot:PDM68137.1 Acetyltransferase [Pristionchus pacificus]
MKISPTTCIDDYVYAGEKRELPENNLLENTLKLAISSEFTATNLEVYGYPDASPQCYFFVEYSDVQCPLIIVRNPLFGPDLSLLKEAIPLVVAKLSDLLAKHNTLLMSGDEATSDEFERHISSLPGTPFQTVPFLSSTGVFYMTQTQREQLLKEKLDAPEGFTFERADADRDAETIHRLWKTALDLEVTKNRLRFLPSACARTESGELAGWAMTSRIGEVTNLYVLPEYRNRGLGKALELSVAKQFASRGMRVLKYVETTNTAVYEGSLRSPLWTLWTTEGSDEEKSPMLHSLRKFVRRSD